MIFRQTGKTCGDETTTYEVTGYKSKKVSELVDEILQENPNEWGYISVGDGWFFNLPHCEYKYGKLLDVLPADVLLKNVVSLSAEGGWTRMDYYIKVE